MLNIPNKSIGDAQKVYRYNPEYVELPLGIAFQGHRWSFNSTDVTRIQYDLTVDAEINKIKSPTSPQRTYPSPTLKGPMMPPLTGW
jgi:hypothetical protein